MLEKRLRALEAGSQSDGWRPFLDTMTDADLERLETALAGDVVLSADIAFVEDLVMQKEASGCAT